MNRNPAIVALDFESAAEARAVPAMAGPRALLVIQSVRSSGASPGDRKRVAAPAEALETVTAHS